MTEINCVRLHVFDDVFIDVYSDGRIKTLDHIKIRSNGRVDNRKGRFLRPSDDTYGYPKITLTSNGVRKSFHVHKLVAEAFIDNPLNKPTVNHINGIKHDNSSKNLEWATHTEQKAHAIATGLCTKNIKALSLANNRRSVPVVYEGVKYPSIREAARISGVDRKKIKREGILINE